MILDETRQRLCSGADLGFGGVTRKLSGFKKISDFLNAMELRTLSCLEHEFLHDIFLQNILSTKS